MPDNKNKSQKQVGGNPQKTGNKDVNLPVVDEDVDISDRQEGDEIREPQRSGRQNQRDQDKNR